MLLRIIAISQGAATHSLAWMWTAQKDRYNIIKLHLLNISHPNIEK